jgi:hypothetical protein
MIYVSCSKEFMLPQGQLELLLGKVQNRLSSGNAYYHSYKNVLSSCLLSEDINIEMHKTVILSVFLCQQNFASHVKGRINKDGA